MNIYIVLKNCTDSKKDDFLNLIKKYIKKEFSLFVDYLDTKPVISFEIYSKMSLGISDDDKSYYMWNFAHSTEKLKFVEEHNSKIFNLNEVQDIKSFVEFLINFMSRQLEFSTEELEIR